MLKRCIQLALSALLFHSFAVASTFHAIVIADTAEKKVHNSAKIDIKRMKHAVRLFAKASRKKLALSILDGKKVTIEGLQRWYDRRKVKKNDILLFYFTGHGFASRSHATIWPDIFFKSKKEILPLESIKDAFFSKKAQLTLVLSDSCNNFQPVRFLSQKRPNVKVTFKPKRRGLKKLFQKKRGQIIASGAMRGTVSYGSDYGGFFTQALLIALQQESSSSKPSWNRVFKKVNELLKQAQKPQYKLYLQNK